MRPLVACVALAVAACSGIAAEWQVTTVSANSAHPTWCGGNIVFHSDRQGGVFQIWGVNEGGESRAFRITNQPWRTFTEPSWHCTEHYVAFQGHHGAGPDTIWVVYDIGPPTFTPIPITLGNGDDESPCYGPVQPGPNRVAFHSDRYDHDDIFGMSDGGETQGITRLTTHPSEDRYPAVSPDGRWIAFASDRSGTFDIWVMSAAGEADSLRQVTSGPESDLEPAWSPGGTHIAFARGGVGIVAADTQSRTEFQVTFGAGDASPAWSPEGDLLAFTRHGAYDQVWCTDNVPPGSVAEERTWGSIKARYR